MPCRLVDTNIYQFTLCAVVTVIHLLVVLFIIIAGLTKASASNMQPFLLDSGPRGIFDGAALVGIHSIQPQKTSSNWLE